MAAAATVAVLALSACTRSGSGSGSNATPLQIFTAGPPAQQIQADLGDSNWWLGAPSFGVRPLDLEYTPETIRFSITQRFIHLGTGDTLTVVYDVYSTTSAASTFMSNEQTGLGTNVVTTPRAGDQVLYTGQKLGTSTALYETAAFIRTGSIVIVADLLQGSGFESFPHMGSLSNQLVSRVKDVLANKLHPSPLASSDESLLPPLGTDITMVGAADLPIQVVAGMLSSASPQGLIKTFTDLGVNDFVYGDYALNTDLHMEVRTAAFSFTTADDANTWIDSAVGAANLTNGVFYTYLDPLKQYLAIFLAGRHVGMLLCKSTLDTEAASRACEAPIGRILPAWANSLSLVS